MFSVGVIVQRLCELQAEVSKHIGYEHAADCFCGGGGYWKLHKKGDYGPTHVEGYRNEGLSLEFIENATRAALAKAHGAGSEDTCEIGPASDCGGPVETCSDKVSRCDAHADVFYSHGAGSEDD